ncbi:MAG: O-acetyl-ADP-ribose deacetylase [Deltaproteobacteria bacterium]|nr:O-acetyl-ADP-ribose deacetylase [Deltaproteobacteria bacterium]
MRTEKTLGATRLVLVDGDITRQETDAIVNAANSGLKGGGGVDGAIHRAGGPTIMEECRQIGHCPTGQAVITTAGKLPAKKVIHTVGPIYRGRPEDAELLASCYRSSLELAARHGLKSVSFPSISTGAYGYPLKEAARVALTTVAAEIAARPAAFDEVRFVLFGETAFQAYQAALETAL